MHRFLSKVPHGNVLLDQKDLEKIIKNRFEMVCLFVTELSKMVNFYKDVIGIHTEWNGEGPYAEFKHEGIQFSMYKRKMLPQLLGKLPEFTNNLNGMFERAFRCSAGKERSGDAGDRNDSKRPCFCEVSSRYGDWRGRCRGTGVRS